MLTFFALTNLTSQSVAPCLPWEFKAELPSEQIRENKKSRQQWHQNAATCWNYYSAFEGANPNQRTSKNNPPRLWHGVTPEFDLPVTLQRAHEVIALWKIKPAYIERSLGGNIRCVFVFPRPLVVESLEFATYLLEKAVEWLALDLLPGVDRPAFLDPNRHYCNGSDWTETGHGAISEIAMQAFFVAAGRSYRFTPADSIEIPLDIVQKALSEKFPHFAWPGEFALESTGPSFFIEGSVSSNSAILKPDGFFSFSAHAAKPFYTWSDILGAEFVKDINDGAIAKATADVWFDGRKFWRKKKGYYTGMDMAELANYMKIDCGIKGKQLDGALSHIYNENHVENASPYIFRPQGLLTFQGRRRLNTAINNVMQPATGTQHWGPSGNFSFLSSLIGNLFTTEIQCDYWRAWYQYFYLSGLNSLPMPGQAIFLMGGVCTGKTFTSREVVGRSVGGYVDAASYIIRSGEFNSHLFESPLWALDDDTVSDSPQAAANMQAMLKKSVANNAFLSNKKFQQAGMVEWSGRVVATTNLDYISSRLLGPLDNSSMDKISVFRCEQTTKTVFPSRAEMERLVSTELPFFLRWLADHVPPDHVIRDSRFGYKSWHEPSLMDQANQTSKSAPFKEILIETLQDFFKDTPDAIEWRGTVSKLIQQLHCNPLHESVIKTLRLEAVARYLENVQKDGALVCRVETGALNTRIWVFPRFGDETPASVEIPPQPNSSVFDKR